MHLTWNKTECLKQNGNITHNIIQYGQGNFRDKRVITKTELTALTIYNLLPYTYYTFTVRGVNIKGMGPPSIPSDLIKTVEDSKLYLHHNLFSLNKVFIFAIMSEQPNLNL